ncbi:protein takeout-like [Condylostylus longicornis]|uniref:protein takeout-like n=1 Tax=Condylostylus longicornis TaxID=2530218 RepID=UPI00244DFB22|nr:protein takeout-like [Condylostylus longicornis]
MIKFIAIAPLGLIIIVNFATILVKGQLPPDVKKCKYEDEQCFIEQFNYVLSNKKNGDRSMNLVSLEPLEITSISIQQPSGSVTIDLRFFNSKLHGLSEARLFSAKGLHKDITKPCEFRAKGDTIMLIGDYKIDGRVLFLPISGGGAANMTIRDYEFKLKYDGTFVEKKGKKHGKVRKLVADLKIGDLDIDFENLFNGNKQLSDNMNVFLNENWREIWNEVKKSAIGAFESVFRTLIDNTFSKLPYDELFSE